MSKTKIIPVSGTLNRLVILPDEPEKISKGGIIIPDTAKEKPRRGKVIAVSSVDEKGNNPTVKVGDKIVYHKFADDEDIIDGVEYIFAKELDVLAILEEDKESI